MQRIAGRPQTEPLDVVHLSSAEGPGAQRYGEPLHGISSRKEAEAYLAHPILGTRLRHCTALVLPLEGQDIEQIFGSPDDLKFRSSMTLFAHVDSESLIFNNALKKYFAGKPDQLTIERLSESIPFA